jgi:two-component system response regulator YesN
MSTRSRSLRLPDRILTLVAELRHHAPEWADRLAQVTSEQQLLDLIAEMFNLQHALRSPREAALPSDLAARIKLFVRMNLHKGLTLKLLGQFLGYSEKYCSDLFQATMGESFSEHVKRHRLETAMTLLATTDHGVAEIATATGFCDQSAFSHFFKRATGQSPMQYRARNRRAATRSASRDHV